MLGLAMILECPQDKFPGCIPDPPTNAIEDNGDQIKLRQIIKTNI